jgi:hypothetical protein
MKNCYFFRGNDGIYVQSARYKEGNEIFISNKEASVTINGKKEITCILDTSTNKRYYPAEDCKQIQ